MPERFRQEKFEVNTDAVFSYFKPDESGRDRFGNRMIGSDRLAYRDLQHRIQKAGLLISPAGEAFIKKNVGILRNLEEALGKLQETKRTDNVPTLDEVLGIFKFMDLKAGPRIAPFKKGSNSQVFLLVDEEKKLVVKIKRPSMRTGTEMTQPYLYEMLQTQEMAMDLKADLDRFKLALSSFLFASSEVLCVAYEEGRLLEQWEFEDEPRIWDFVPIARDYISKKNLEEDSIWKGVHFDDIHEKNFLRRTTDDVIVLIDPLLNEDSS